MQYFCYHGHIIERRFSLIFLGEYIIFMTWIGRDYVKDHFSFNLSLQSLALKMKLLQFF